MSGDWYTLGRKVLAEWQAAGRAAAEGARTAPLTRALDCVDAADEVVAAAQELKAPSPRLVAAVMAYKQSRGER